jgi:hypothetical protein
LHMEHDRLETLKEVSKNFLKLEMRDIHHSIIHPRTLTLATRLRYQII